jgi:hypothetical protein
MKKILFTIFISIVSMHATSADIEGSDASELKTKKETVFGVVLGVSTIDDIKKLSFSHLSTRCESFYSSSSYCDNGFYSESYLTVEHQGKVASMEKPFNASVIKFEIGEQNFKGKFIDGKIFELQPLQSSYTEEFDDIKFINDLKLNFNKKYDKKKGYSIKEKDDFKNYTHNYLNWSERNNSFQIQLKETRKIVINEFACLSMARTMQSAGMRTAQFEYDCKKITDNIPRFKIRYKDEELNLKAFKLAAEEEARIAKEKMENKNKNLNQF